MHDSKQLTVERDPKILTRFEQENRLHAGELSRIDVEPLVAVVHQGQVVEQGHRLGRDDFVLRDGEQRRLVERQAPLNRAE